MPLACKVRLALEVCSSESCNDTIELAYVIWSLALSLELAYLVSSSDMLIHVENTWV
jgi:hypothetical protein